VEENVLIVLLGAAQWGCWTRANHSGPPYCLKEWQEEGEMKVVHKQTGINAWMGEWISAKLDGTGANKLTRESGTIDLAFFLGEEMVSVSGTSRVGERLALPIVGIEEPTLHKTGACRGARILSKGNVHCP
jgi:hypothetical protein